MSIERFIVCSCGHGIDQHGAEGCGHLVARGRPQCSCRNSRRGVLEALLDAERDAIRQEWRRQDTRW